jgi:hypothetical protein
MSSGSYLKPFHGPKKERERADMCVAIPLCNLWRYSLKTLNSSAVGHAGCTGFGNMALKQKGIWLMGIIILMGLN